MQQPQSTRKSQDLALSLDVLERLNDFFSLQIVCRSCQLIISDQSLGKIIQHKNDCFQNVNANVQNQIPQAKPVIDSNMQVINQNNDSKIFELNEELSVTIQNEVRVVLSKGNIKKSSQRQYKKTLEQFYVWLYQSTGRMDPKAEDFEKYILQTDLSVNSLNALSRLRIVKKILLNQGQLQLCKMQKITAQEKVQSNPHQVWQIDTIQEFIDTLFLNNFTILAFRIYILFELASRIGELKQISFEMILSGIVSYIPEKQSRRQESARRVLKMSEKIIQTTDRFIKENFVAAESKLNIGYQKDTVSERAMLQQLSVALSFLKRKEFSKDQQLQQLLSSFSYHDLRHSKLSYLKNIGASNQSIAQFINHQDLKTTLIYTKKSQNQMMTLHAENLPNQTEPRQLRLYQ